MELVVEFAPGSPHDGPDNITAGPHGFALACTDGEDDQWLIWIDDAGGIFPFAATPATPATARSSPAPPSPPRATSST